MSERSVNVSEKGRTVEDAVTVFAAGKVYDGWEDLKIVKQVNSVASSFEMQLTDRWAEGQETWSLKPGEKIHIHIGKRSALSGYIDSVDASISAQARTITISGRSKTSDLVDCSVEGPAEYLGLNLKEIAEKVCAPFGIVVSFQTEIGEPFEKITLQNGETAFALLERLSKQRRVLLYPDAEGRLIFASQGVAKAATALIVGVNVLKANSKHDFSDRFSKYTTKGQNIGFFGEGEDVTAPVGEATDDAISRYRPLVILSENPTDTGASENRAAFEAHYRAAKSQTATVEVVGAFEAPDVLWDINRIISCDLGPVGLRRNMLIDKVEFNKGNGGTRTVLTLVRQDAYNFSSKKVKKESDLSWAKAL